MTDAALLREAADLSARGEPYALATVVRREAPSSARPGLKALVLPDGTLRGWLGGACIEPAVVREARSALESGRPRLLVFAPGGAEGRPGDAGRPDTVVHPMTCHSGGTVEIYVEPQLPSPLLVLFGDSPVSRALAAAAPIAGYRVRVVGAGDAAEAYPGAEVVEALEPGVGSGPAALFAVVATMGEWDEDAAERALAAGAGYVGVVSSPRRAAEIRAVLEERGVGKESLERLSSPAGLDLGAETPGEIAITILAELLERRRRDRGARPNAAEAGTGDAARADAGAGEGAGSATHATAVDPVCGMEVEVSGARHRHEHRGTVYFFCCPRCRERFARDPDRFVAA